MSAQQFVEEATWHGMHKDRIDAWLFCNANFGTPFPDESWTEEEITSVSNQTLDAHIRYMQNMQNRNWFDDFLDGFTEGCMEIVSRIGAQTVNSYFNHRR